MDNKCKVCNKEYSDTCNWQQGRCPSHLPTIKLTNTQVQNRFKIAKRGLWVAIGCLLWVSNVGFMVNLAGILIIIAEVLEFFEEFA